MSNGWLKWGVVVAFAVLAGVAVNLLATRQPALELRSGTLLKVPRPAPEFSLSGADGQPLTRADLEGRWTVLFAGFTFCPDVCPTTLAEMKAVRAALAAATREQVQMLFLSVDPERDTPEQIGKYLAFFDPAFRGATGDDAALQALGAALGFVYARVPGATPSTYTIDHSTALILIDPQARVAGYLTPPFKTTQLAADLDAVVAQTSALP